MLTLIWIINLVFGVYEFLIFIRVLLSWVNINPNHPLVRILYSLTDPLLKPIQRLIPPIGGTIDISPAVALILLYIVQRVLISLLL
jgi:YggT family protein